MTDDSSSVGSLYSWKGEIVGQGEIEHLKLQRGRLIEEEIRFVKPFKSKSNVAFNLEPAGDGTKVTWHMRGALPWFLFWMTPQMEIFIGMDYERGLKMLKERIETGTVFTQTNIRGVEDVGPLQMAGIRKQCKLSEVGPAMEATCEEARQLFSQHDLPIDGQVMTVYHDCNLKTQVFDFTSGFTLPESATVPNDMSSWTLPPTKALAVEHTGTYQHLGNGWSAANQYARYKKLKQSKVGAYEIYINDPCETAPADLRAEIYLPLR